MIPGGPGRAALGLFSNPTATAKAIDRRLARSRFSTELEALWRLRRLQRANDPERKSIDDRQMLLDEEHFLEAVPLSELPWALMRIDDGVVENAARLLALTDELADWVGDGVWGGPRHPLEHVREFELILARVLALAQLGRLAEAARLSHLNETVGVLLQRARGPDDRLRLAIIGD